MMSDVERWPPPWFVGSVIGFGAFATIGTVVGLVTGNSPASALAAIVGGIGGATGLFFVGMLFVLRAWLGAKVEGDGSVGRISKASRVFAGVVGAAFAVLAAGLVLFVAGVIS